MKSADLMHLDPAVRPLALLEGEERRRAVYQNRWIDYPRARSVLSRMEGLLGTPNPANLLLVGEWNNGKAALVRRFLQDQAGVLQVWGGHGGPQLSRSLLSAATDEACPRWSAARVRACLRDEVKARGVRLLVIGNIHDGWPAPGGTLPRPHEVERYRNRAKAYRTGLEEVRADLGLPILAWGGYRAAELLAGAGQPWDLAALPAWELNGAWRDFVLACMRLLPLRRPSEVDTPGLLAQLHALSEGTVGGLTERLEDLAWEAVDSGHERIDQALLDRAPRLSSSERVRRLTHSLAHQRALELGQHSRAGYLGSGRRPRTTRRSLAPTRPVRPPLRETEIIPLISVNMLKGSWQQQIFSGGMRMNHRAKVLETLRELGLIPALDEAAVRRARAALPDHWNAADEGLREQWYVTALQAVLDPPEATPLGREVEALCQAVLGCREHESPEFRAALRRALSEPGEPLTKGGIRAWLRAL